MAKKKNKVKIPYCPVCGKQAVLVKGKEIAKRFPNAAAHPEEYFWVCSDERCATYVACKTGTKIPRGKMESKSTHFIRFCTHRVFDRIHESGLMSRSDAYGWISVKLGYAPGRTCHIGMAGDVECSQIIRLSAELLKARNIPYPVVYEKRGLDSCRRLVMQ